jgi:uncharacterized protein YbaA (DUF1428 family)
MGYAFVNNHLIECAQNDLPTRMVTQENEPVDWHGDEFFENAWMWFPTLEQAQRVLRLVAYNDFQRLIHATVRFFPDQTNMLGWKRIPDPLFNSLVKAHQKKWGEFALVSFERWRMAGRGTEAHESAKARDAKANKLLSTDRWPEAV